MRRRPMARPRRTWFLAIRVGPVLSGVKVQEVLGARLTDCRVRPGERGPWEVAVAPAALGKPRAW